MGIGLRMVTFANQAGESILLHSDIIRMIFRRQKIMWFKRCADLLIQALYDRLNFLGRNRLSTLHAALRSQKLGGQRNRGHHRNPVCAADGAMRAHFIHFSVHARGRFKQGRLFFRRARQPVRLTKNVHFDLGGAHACSPYVWSSARAGVSTGMEDCGSLSSRVCKCALASSIVTARASRSVRSAAHSWRACSSAFRISSHLARICLSCCVKSLCVCRYWPLRSINRPIFCASASNSFSMDSFLDKKLHFNGYRMCLASKCCKSALVTTSEFMRFAHGSDAGNGSTALNPL